MQNNINNNNQQRHDECPICLAPLGPTGKALFTTSCGHQFHFDCIKNLKDYAHTACPMCRIPVPQLNQISPNIPANLPPLGVPPPRYFQAPPPAQLPQQSLFNPPNLASSNFVSKAAHRQLTDILPPNSHEEQLVDEIAVKNLMKKDSSSKLNDRALTIVPTLELDEVGAKERKNLLAMLSIQAPSDQNATNATRAPLDLVAVVDTSGSMSGHKISLVIRTLRFLLTQLSPLDRFCLIGFSNTATLFHNLKKVHESNRLEDCVNMLEARGGTSIGSGLQVALTTLENRRSKNPIASILLLTDGQDSSVMSQLPIFAQRLPDGCSAHSFGYGKDHDATILGKWTELTGGTFTFVENDDTIAPAFGNCLGGLLSVVAQNIVIKFETHQGVKVEKVLSHYRSQIKSNNTQVFLPDLFAEERRDIVLSLEIAGLQKPETRQVVARAKIEYKDPLLVGDQQNLIRQTEWVEFSLGRPEISQSCAGPNPKLTQQRKRISVVESLTRAMDEAQQQKFARAQEILDQAIRELLDLPPNSNVNVQPPQDPLITSLYVDLIECKRRVSSQSEWSRGGHAYVQNQWMQHQQQRSQSSAPSPYITNCQITNANNFNHYI